jgi:hypothetical protein
LFENLGLRVFRLSERPSDQGICCNAEGVFVGSVPLLEHLGLNRRAKEQWVVRPQAELNERLALLYEMPVDVAAKIGGIETIARGPQ